MNVMRIGNQNNRTNFNGEGCFFIRSYGVCLDAGREFSREIQGLISKIPDDMVKGVRKEDGKKLIFLQDGTAIDFKCEKTRFKHHEMSLGVTTLDGFIKWFTCYGPFTRPKNDGFDLALGRLHEIFEKFSGS